MNLFNIGGEGQLYAGAITGATVALLLGGAPSPLIIVAMIARGRGRRRARRGDPRRAAGVLLDERDHHVADAQLRRRRSCSTYLIFDSHSYLRDTTGFEAQRIPAREDAPRRGDLAELDDSRARPAARLPRSRSCLAAAVWVLYTRTRFGFEVQVIGDSPRAGRYAGMRTRRKIIAVMCLSGAIAGFGGASQDGDFRHQLDPRDCSRRTTATRASSSRLSLATTRLRSCSSRSCSVDYRTPASRCRAPTSRLGSSASCRD